MLPILSHMRQAIRPGFHYIEDLAGDGALIGVGRAEDTNDARGVEVIVAMRVMPDDDEPEEDGSMEIALATLLLSPEAARRLALKLTASSITVDIENGDDGS